LTVMADSSSTALSGPARPDETPDDRLVEQFVRGDPSAFDRIVARHHDRVAALACRLLGWADGTEDVVQEVFLSALENLPKFRRNATLSTWLIAITLNRCRSYRRRRFLRLRFFASARKNLRQGPSAPADRQTLERETFDQVRHAVQALASRDREVIVLRYLEEMPITEISQALRLSPNAVEVRLTRARRRLADLLAPFMEDTGHDR
jgi:RNA polymerase sigma factor (sigma-70 family)